MDTPGGRRWLIGLPALLVFLIYLPTIRFEFVWDDVTFLRESALYRDPALWPQALRQPFVFSPNYFRPLVLLTFIAETQLAGLKPALAHTTNLLLHVLNTLLVALLARRLWASADDETRGSVWLPVAAGLLFGLHPAVIEGVAFISSRFDLMVTTFLLVALLAECTLSRRGLRIVAVAAAFFLAALCKEMAAAFAIVYPLWRLARTRTPVFPLSKSLRATEPTLYGALFLAGLAYLGLRYAAFGYILADETGNVVPTGNLLQHFLLIAQSLAGYAQLVVWPFTSLTPLHTGTLPVPSGDAAAWSCVAAVVLLMVVLVIWVRKHGASGWLAVAGLAALLPVLNVRPLNLEGGAFMAERYLLFPLALFALAFTGMWRQVMRNPDSLPRWSMVGLRIIPAVWLVAAAATVQLTLPHWENEMTLWTWTEPRAPGSPTPAINLSWQLSQRGRYADGLAAAQRAIAIEPEAAMAWNNAGLAYYNMKQMDGARAGFEKAVSLQPNKALFWNNLAGVLMDQEDFPAAERILKENVFRIDEHHPLGRLNLGSLYLQIGRPDLAIPELGTAVRLLPPGQQAKAELFLAQSREPGRWIALGERALADGAHRAALRAFEEAGNFGADPGDVAVSLSAVYFERNDFAKAERVLTDGLASAPDDPRLHNNLGLACKHLGKLDPARNHFARAVSLAPDWSIPRQNLDALAPPLD